MKRPFKNKKPLASFADLIGKRRTGSRIEKNFSGSHDSFTMLLEYQIVTRDPVSESDIVEQTEMLEDALNEYLFSGPDARHIVYFMRSDSESTDNTSYRLVFAVDTDIWEGRLGSEGKYEGSLAGTEKLLNEELGIGAVVDSSYLHIYPTEKAREVQKQGYID